MMAIISKRWLRLLSLTLIAFAFLFAAFPGPALAGKPVKMHFFMTLECPHCKAEKAFLEKLKQRYPELEIIAHEVTKSEDEARYFAKMSEAYGAKVTGVPATFIGHFSPIIGFQDESTTGALIESRVKYCADSGCIDPAESVRERFPLMEPAPPGVLLLGEEQPSDEVVCPDDIPCVEGERVPPPEEAAEEPAEAEIQTLPEAEEPAPPPGNEDIISLPLVGKVEASRMALPVLTVTIAALDGFNPCAFFVLFMLLGMLVHVHSRRRMLLVGGIFVFFSGFIYFIFMAAWLNVFLLSGEIKAITVIAGLVALVIAVINIKEYFYFRRGVSLSIPDSAKPRLFDRMRKLLKASSLASIIFGTVVLAIAANAYELLCTAGFPMVFTRVLTLHELSTAAYYLYLVFYNVVYVVPLATIVVLFTITLGSRKLSEHQGQVLKLISGVMMLYLALVILIKPALLGNILVAGGLLLAALVTSGLVMLISSVLHRHQKN
jgi:thiol-disulfide isomerase/thioredoxin